MAKMILGKGHFPRSPAETPACTVVDFTAESFRRERFDITLAGELRSTFANTDPEEDTRPPQAWIAETVSILRGLDQDILDQQYRLIVAEFAVPRGRPVDWATDPTPHHKRCLDRSRRYLVELERDFGIKLFGNGRPR
jgi:hypothetical protein